LARRRRRPDGKRRASNLKALGLGGGIDHDGRDPEALSIDETSQFEGSSRRVEDPTDPSSSVDAQGSHKDPQKKDVAPAPLPSIDADLQRLEGSAPTEWSESTVGLKQ
jgi:hypothetical protein